MYEISSIDISVAAPIKPASTPIDTALAAVGIAARDPTCSERLKYQDRL
jgi:hypothetical protein